MAVTDDYILGLLEGVMDPEVPVLSILDLGIVRQINAAQKTIVITPTYSGCPAMQTIEDDIQILFKEKGLSDFQIETTLTPAWTTDWMTESGKEKLRAYGIAPPVGTSNDKNVLFGDEKVVACPQCKSKQTSLVSQFGSTACKALYKCTECLEPFDYFKCL